LLDYDPAQLTDTIQELDYQRPQLRGG